MYGPSRQTYRIFVIGLGLMVLSWIADAAVDAAFDRESFFSQVFMPDDHEIALRLVFITSQLLFLLYIARLLRRRHSLEEELAGALQHTEAERTKSEAILEAFGDGISIQDPELRIIYQNSAHRRQMGEHLGELCYRAYQGREEPCPDCHLQKSFTDGQVHMRQTSAQTSAGLRHAEIVSTPLFDHEGNLIAGIEAVRDITARRAIEDRLRQQLAAMESSMDGIALLDENGCYTYLNRAHARIYGYATTGALLGQSWRSLYGPDELQRFDREVMPEFQKHGRWRGEAEGRRADGSSFAQELSLTATEGNGIVCIVRNINRRKEAEQAIRDMNRDLRQHAAELEAANSELEAFSYSLSHDLRSFLTRISMAGQALQEFEGARLGGEGTVCLQTILGASEGMENLIQAMLALAGVTRQEMSRESVDLSDLAGTVTEELLKAEPGRRARITVTPGLQAQGDPLLLRVVLENLFSNALKYTVEREEARISFSAVERDGRRTFAVADNGIGFDMTEVGELFRPFHRLAGTRRFPGLGIGLSTVRRIIHRHGGEIWAEAVPGQGATFFFTLSEPEPPAQPGAAD